MSLDAKSLFSLDGKTALLTGASGFLGRNLGSVLLANGARVIALARSERLESVSAAWAREFGAERVRSYRVDMYDRVALERTLDEIVSSEPSVDVLVNNAHELGPQTGFNTAEDSLEHGTFDQWMRNLTGGLYWAALTTQKVGPSMKARRRGSIVNVSSMYAQVAPSPDLYVGTRFVNPPGYSTAKAGLVALTRYVASFWGPYGVRANAILPGPFSNTEEEGPNSVPPTDPFLERLRVRTCLRRLGKPADLVGILLFLASDASSYVTGQAIIIDGGWTIM